MAKRTRDWRDGIGRPAMAVLFRTPAEWRFAIYLDAGGVMDGRLPNEPAERTAESAQRAMRRWIEEAFEITAVVTWASTDKPDWWAGTIAEGGDANRMRPE